MDQVSSTRGGDIVALAGGGVGNLSLIDLVGPNRVFYHTDDRGLEGWVVDDAASGGPASGTSYAAPIVAGLAAVVKDFWVAKGVAWVNYPGALQTVMLAMGDRHYSTTPTNTNVSTAQRTTGSNDLYGVGRAKVRWLEESGVGSLGNVRTKMQENTFWSFTADSSTLAWTTPLPAGIKIVKCVMLQMEDASESGAHNFSDVDLSVRIRLPSGSACSLQGNLVSNTTDASHDVKSMVAVEDPTLAGKCVEVFIDKVAVPQAGITTRTFCYAAATVDDEPQ